MSKIVCISASEIPSFTANSMQTMKACQALTKLGHQVQLLLPGMNQTSWEQLASHYGLTEQFEIYWLPADLRFRRYDFSWYAIKFARQQAAEILYVWPLQAAVIAAYLHLPILLEMHGPPEGHFGPVLFRLLLRAGGKKRYLPITRALASLLEREFNYQFAPEELAFAPNGVDLDRYHGLPNPSEARQSLGLPEILTAGYTGHMYAGRGMNMLVTLARRFSQIQFLWVGGRPKDVEEWQRKLSAQGIDNIILTGFIENSTLPQYQAAADILLMPYERFIAGSSGGNSAEYCSPMKVFEYLASGRAIISSDLPVIREILDENNAILCPPQDSDAWTAAFKEILENPDRRQTLARNALQTANKYTWEARARRALEGFV